MKNSEKLKNLYEESPFDEFHCMVDGCDQFKSVKIREFLEGAVEADDEIEELAEGLIGAIEHLIKMYNGEIKSKYKF